MQDDITQQILSSLNIELEGQSRSRQQVDLLAYNAYLRGQYHWNRREHEIAIDYYEQAIELDPNYAEAYVVLADSLTFFSLNISESDRQRIDSYINRAREINPELPVLRMIEADRKLYSEHTYQEYIDEIYELLQNEPHNTRIIWAFADAFEILGEYDVSAECYAHIIEINPLDAAGHNFYATLLIKAGRYEEARDSIAQAELLGSPFTANKFASLESELGNAQGLAAQLARENAYWEDQVVERLYYQTALAVLQGDREEAQRLVNSSDRSLWEHREFPINLLTRLVNDDMEEAIRFTAESLAAEDKIAFWYLLGTEFLRQNFPEYFSDPGYLALLEEYGLDQESIAEIRIPPLPF